MSLKLDDSKKRLLPPTESEGQKATAATPPAEARVEAASINATVTLSVVARDTESIAEAVRKVFGQVGTLHNGVDEFTQAADQLERLSKSVTRIFGPLRAVYSQLTDVADSFASLQSFQLQLASLSDEFEPMRLLHEQVAQLTDNIQVELGQVVKALDPVKEINDRVTLLARSLKQVSDLHTDFADLNAAFNNRQPSATNAPDLGDREEMALH